MIKLLAMSLFIAAGLVVGGLFFRLFSKNRLSLPVCLTLGVLGAFAGMLLADLADIRLVGNVADSLLFSCLGSVVLLGLNLFSRGRH